jgi:hypothetical protein
MQRFLARKKTVWPAGVGRKPLFNFKIADGREEEDCGMPLTY